MNLRIIVFGHHDHGKQQLCNMLQQSLGLTSIKGRVAASEIVAYRKLGYNTPEDMVSDLDKYRDLWDDIIRTYNTPDKTRLGREIFQRYNIYSGLRDKEEFQALKDAYEFDLAIWVDASKRISSRHNSNFTVTQDLAYITISNNTTQDEYRSRIRDFIKDLYTGNLKSSYSE